MNDAVPPGELDVVPANEATWDDIRAVFGTTDQPGRCQCRRYQVLGHVWSTSTPEERAAGLREQTGCDDPGARSTNGLVAYLRGEPVGWAAVAPRISYPRLLRTRVPWTGRREDRDDDGVWAVTCLLTRRGFRRRGITYGLAAATVPHARAHGARALEAYPMLTAPGVEITWGELHVGARQVFAEAGFQEVSRPTPRRVVMRIDF